MSVKRTCLVLFAYLLTSFSIAMAQDTPAPPAIPATPDAPMEFSFHLGGGSFLGIYPEEITSENMGRFNLRIVRGVAVSKVVEGSPAEKAGLRKDDVVFRFNGEEVTSVRKLNRLISEVAPDHTVRLTISRNGAEQEVSVTLDKRKDLDSMMSADSGLIRRNLEEFTRAPRARLFDLSSSRRIGVSTSALTKQLADYFGIAGDKGVLVTNVKEESPAARAGVKAGDVITEVDGEKIDGAGDLSRAINRKSEGDITLTIVRDKSQRTLRVTPEKMEATPMIGPEFNIETAPRVGALEIPNRLVLSKVNRIVMPRIEALIERRPL